MNYNEPMDAAKVALIDGLNDDLQRKANDLFRYVLESGSYIPKGDEHIMPLFERLARIETDNAESLAAAIRLLEGVPSPGVWDLGVADMNYLNVRFVAKQVIEQLEESVRRLERRLEQSENYPRVKAIVLSVFDDTKFQIDQIKLALDRTSTTPARPAVAKKDIAPAKPAPVAKPVAKSAVKATGGSPDKAPPQTPENPSERPSEKPSESPAKPPVEKPPVHPPEKPMAPPVENPAPPKPPVGAPAPQAKPAAAASKAPQPAAGGANKSKKRRK